MNIRDDINYETKQLKCGVCGKWFNPKDDKQFYNLIKKSNKYNRPFYCSDECKRIKRGSKYLNCATCGKQIYVIASAIRTNNYCSKECYYKSLNANQNANKNANKNEILKCQNCEKEFVKRKGSFGKFCSKECYHQWNIKQIDKIIENNEIVSHRVLRNYYIRHYNKCMNPKCKWDWENNNENNPSLELHHIDGNHHNNTLDNTILLCPNCHSMTDNYKYKKRHTSTRTYRIKYR